MPTPTDRRALDVALDELYDADPAEFVTTRKRLGARLRAAGAAGEAKALEAARRPTKAAWALNQLARHRPDLVERLLDRSRQLRAAQSHASSGGGDALRATIRAQREAVAEVVEQALAFVGPDASEPYRTRIITSLQAASADESLGEALSAGRLTRELTPSAGFLDAGTVAPTRPVVDSTPTEPSDTTRHQRVPRERLERERTARERAEREQLEREHAEAKLAEAKRARHAAHESSSAAAAAVAHAQARLDRLRAEIDDARAALRGAEDAAVAARREEARLEKGVERLAASRTRPGGPA